MKRNILLLIILSLFLQGLSFAKKINKGENKIDIKYEYGNISLWK